MLDTSKFTGHTPGPWTPLYYANSFGERGYRISTAYTTTRIIATVTNETGKQHKFNARLIAAAPELLAEVERLREALCRVVKEARRQHSSVLDEIQERDYLAPCKYCKQPPVVDIDFVPPDGPETTTLIYCGTTGCPNTEEDELESMVMCFEDSQSLWNYRNAPRTNWIAVEIEKERDNALAEVERLREALRACVNAVEDVGWGYEGDHGVVNRVNIIADDALGEENSNA